MIHRYYYHTRGTSARDIAFIAGKGQPHRTELVDPAAGDVRQVEKIDLDGNSGNGRLDRSSGLAHETARRAQRIDRGAVYSAKEPDTT